ncbi:hypothetical protein PMAYCL1PPCAC_12737, partial [Pristionchus mayeri]
LRMFPYPGMGVINPLYAAQLAALNPLGRGKLRDGYCAVVGVPQPGTALLGVQSLPRPMLVPPGMGVEGGAASPSPSASNWTEHKHEDGRVYYHNKVTRQSVWTKPDELKTPAERGASSSGGDSWKEYTTGEGKKYYYNQSTKETTWTVPEGFNPTSGASEKKEESAKEVKEEGGQSELERAMAATLASLPKETSISVATLSDVPMIDPDVELKKRQADRFTELLRDKYKDGKITATCNWDKAVPFIQSDPRFRILSKVSEKKQLFNAWKVQKQKEERDEKRMAVKKAKEDLETWLLTHPKMKNNGLQYRRADEIFASEPIWKAVAEDDRREIFRETHMTVTKKDEAEKAEIAKRNVQALNDILENMGEITYRTTWAQAQRLLIENSEFAADDTLQSMDKMDALIVFEKHIKNLEKQYDEEKLNDDKRLRRQERKTREAFQLLLKELHDKGELTSVSLWSTLYTTIASDSRFDTMLHQSGSTPLDLFKFYVEDLKEQYGNDRKIIKDIIAAQGKSIEVNTTFDELVSWVHEDERGKKVDMGNLKLCYNSFVEKAESKEKEMEREEARKKRRIESEFRNLLR